MGLPLEKKTGTNFGPPGNSRLVYFLDDLNLSEVRLACVVHGTSDRATTRLRRLLEHMCSPSPEHKVRRKPTPPVQCKCLSVNTLIWFPSFVQVDPYNTQSAIALLRQHMEYEHTYDLAKLSLKNIANTQVRQQRTMPTLGSSFNSGRVAHFASFSVGRNDYNTQFTLNVHVVFMGLQLVVNCPCYNVHEPCNIPPRLTVFFSSDHPRNIPSRPAELFFHVVGSLIAPAPQTTGPSFLAVLPLPATRGQVVACMNPTAGSFLVNPRLQRWFATFAIGLPGPTSLLTIYQVGKIGIR